MSSKKKPTLGLPKKVRRLGWILGDQLDRESLLFKDWDPKQDLLVMVELCGEAEHVWNHKQRILIFLSAMRHFAEEINSKKWPLYYVDIENKDNTQSFEKEVDRILAMFCPQELCLVLPGEHRVKEIFEKASKKHGVELKVLPDQHFLSSPEDFRHHAQGRKQLRMEFFYREMRHRYSVLMNGEKPEGGDWNYDSENRKSFSKQGPPENISYWKRPDSKILEETRALVAKKFSSHPGSMDDFIWPLTPAEAEKSLDHFLKKRLNEFGHYQDAMWTGENLLFHSLISSSLNLKLLHPLKVIQKAENLYRKGLAPLAAVEGFIRQVLGWREYVRGVYWLHMPEYISRNTLKAKEPLPDFFWTGETDMHCLHHTISETLKWGYSHHIQRLMVTGLYCLLKGVDPLEVHKWYLAMYVDAVEWVELPNTLGMSQYADGGVMASKPYVASGKYIDRMSNFCKQCRYDPALSEGPKACPITKLYWDFLSRHEKLLSRNPRMGMQLRNLQNRKKMASST